MSRSSQGYRSKLSALGRVVISRQFMFRLRRQNHLQLVWKIGDAQSKPALKKVHFGPRNQQGAAKPPRKKIWNVQIDTRLGKHHMHGTPLIARWMTKGAWRTKTTPDRPAIGSKSGRPRPPTL